MKQNMPYPRFGRTSLDNLKIMLTCRGFNINKYISVHTGGNRIQGDVFKKPSAKQLINRAY